MKKITIGLSLFVLTACSKKDISTNTPTPPTDTTSVVKKAGIVTAQFVDGKKLYDYQYDVNDKLIKVIRYNSTIGAVDTVRDITTYEYNAKGLVIKSSVRRPDSTYDYSYDEYTYDTKDHPITHKSYSFDFFQRNYTKDYDWTRTSVNYDSKGNIIKTEADDKDERGNTTKEKAEYKYDALGNLIEYSRFFFDNGVNDFVIAENRKVEYYPDILIPVAMLTDASYPLNQMKQFFKKIIGDDKYALSTSTVTILEKDAKNNPTKIKIDENDVRKSNGMVYTDTKTITFIYKQ